MKFKLTEYEHKESNETITQIDKWYDRHVRLWCIQCKNSEGDQIGDTFYSDKNGVEIEYKRLLNEYKLERGY